MEKNRYNSATSIPMWLLSTTLVFLALRLGLGVWEVFSPPKPTGEIAWRTIDKISDADKASAKLYFYDFRADWCDPCKKMDLSAFSSKDVISIMAKDFIAVKVTDRKREDGKNSPVVQDLEDNFSVQAFPSLVVSMPDGTKVADHFGAQSSVELKKFLQESVMISSYFKGKESAIGGDYQAAANSFDEFLRNSSWQHWRCAYAAIFDSIMLRQLGRNDLADKVITDAMEKVHDHTFPYPVIEYLAGKQTFDQLLSSASENKANRTLCYAYGGMDDCARRKYDAAKTKFHWVLTNSDDKETFEYRISKAETQRLTMTTEIRK